MLNEPAFRLRHEVKYRSTILLYSSSCSLSQTIPQSKICLNREIGPWVPYLSTKGMLRSSMKNNMVFPEPRPQSLIPSFYKPQFIMFSYNEADVERLLKFMTYFWNFSLESFLQYQLMRVVFPVPALPIYKIGFFYNT